MARDEEYDWIDDAFDSSKEDPLAAKGMTGCSSVALVVAVLGVIAILAFVALLAPLAGNFLGLLGSS